VWAAEYGHASQVANPQQMRWLVDYTAQQCSGIGYWYRAGDHIEKAFVFGGMPARSGDVGPARAGRLAGFSGPDRKERPAF
jgi:hypothetical protein